MDCDDTRCIECLHYPRNGLTCNSICLACIDHEYFIGLCNHCVFKQNREKSIMCEDCRNENYAYFKEENKNMAKHIDATKGEDMVNHPSHYADSTSIECIESMELTFGTEVVYHFAVGNAYKYLWRHKNKGRVEEDLNKANWYYHKAKHLLEKGKEEVVVYPYEERQLSILKFYINDYACRAGVQLKEVYFSGEAI